MWLCAQFRPVFKAIPKYNFSLSVLLSSVCKVVHAHTESPCTDGPVGETVLFKLNFSQPSYKLFSQDASTKKKKKKEKPDLKKTEETLRHKYYFLDFQNFLR